MRYNINQNYWDKRFKDMGGKRTVGHKDWTEEEYAKANAYFFDKINTLINDSSYCMIDGCNLLDFGVGIGRCCQYLKDKFNPDKYVGYDIVDNGVPDITFRKIKENGNLYLEPKHYFIVWTYVVLQHIVDDALLEYYVKQIYDGMEDNGLWLVTEAIGDKSNHYVRHRPLEYYMKLFLNAGFRAEVVMMDNLGTSIDHATYFLIK